MMYLRNFFVLIVLWLCFQAPTSQAAQPIIPSQMPGIGFIRTVFQRSWHPSDADRSHGVALFWDYPQLIALDANHRKVVSRMNAELNRQLMINLRGLLGPEYDHWTTSTMAAIADRVVEDGRQLWQSDPSSAGTAYAYDLSFGRYNPWPMILVVTSTISTYAGGAYPETNNVNFVFDVQSGQRLRRQDVIRPEHLEDFMRLVDQKLLAAPLRQQVSADYAADFARFVQHPPKMTVAQQIKNFGSAVNFYVTKTSIVVHYNAEEIGSHALGDVDVAIPYQDIKPWLTKKFLARLHHP